MKILQILYEINNGGIETILLNYLENFNDKSIKMDIVVCAKGNEIQECKYRSLGCNIYYLESFRANLKKTFFKLDKIIKNGNYDIVHSRLNYRSFLPLYIAKKYNVPVRIAHSHISNEPASIKRRFEKKILTKITRKYATDYMACSVLAGEWFIGNDFSRLKNCYVLNNSIDIEKFKFDEEKRNQLRKQFHCENKFVLGNIARFTIQKNHIFLIDIFNEYLQMNQNSVLFLVGDGPKKDDIVDYIHYKNLDEKVVLYGATSKPQELYNLFDTFVFPSIYEGWGNVLIEAQSNGLNCVASEKVIPLEINLTNQIKFISLDNDAKNWAKEIDNQIADSNRFFGYDILKNSNFNIVNGAHMLEDKYKNLLSERVRK